MRTTVLMIAALIGLALLPLGQCGHVLVDDEEIDLRRTRTSRPRPAHSRGA